MRVTSQSLDVLNELIRSRMVAYPVSIDEYLVRILPLEKEMVRKLFYAKFLK